MTRIRTQALSALQRLYRFSGGRTHNDEVDLSRPVIVVHDVAAEAVREQSLSVVSTLDVTTDGAGTVTYAALSIDDIHSQNEADLLSKGLPLSQCHVYLMEIVARLTSGASSDLVGALWGITFPTRNVTNPGAPAGSRVLGSTNQVAQPSVAAGAQQLYYRDATGTGDRPAHWISSTPLPALFDRIEAFAVDDATGAVTVEIAAIVKFVPVNAAP